MPDGGERPRTAAHGAWCIRPEHGTSADDGPLFVIFAVHAVCHARSSSFAPLVTCAIRHLRRSPPPFALPPELERETGKLVYSYDLKVAGKSGMEEVNVSAMTGKVLAREHESAAKVKKEASGALEEFLARKQATPASGTTVVFDRKKDALYFSKTVIPYVRKEGHAGIYRHIGLYGYRKASLARYVELAPAPLEQTEGLEQLRALENGMAVRVAIVDYRGRTHWSIDAPEDVAVAEAIIAREGELLAQSSNVGGA